MKLIKQLRIYDSLQGLAPLVLGLILGLLGDKIVFLKIIYFILIAFCQQLFIYLFNDWTDVQRDLSNPRKKDVSKFSTNKVLIPLLYFLGFTSVLGTFWIPLNSNIFLLFGFFSGVFHSFPVIRFKDKIFGPIFSHLTFGISYTLAGFFFLSEFNQLNFIVIFSAIYFGLIFLSGGIFNELIDFEFDRLFKPRSLISVFGKEFVFKLIIFLQFLSVSITIFLLKPILAIIFLLIYVIILKRLSLNPCKQKDLFIFRSFYKTYFLIYFILWGVFFNGPGYLWKKFQLFFLY
jgi:4-hydroxybenzoate polyprenyltransferase